MDYYPFHDITLHILPIKICVFHVQGLIARILGQVTYFQKKGNVYRKRMLVTSSSPIQTFFEKILQQNKFLLIFRERGPSLKERHTFCVDNFLLLSLLYFVTFNFLLIGIHSTEGWTSTTRHGVTRKRSTKKMMAYRKSVYKKPTVKRCL